MAEYIEREALITLIEDKHTEGYELCMPMELKAHYVAGLQKAKQFVERAPAADVAVVKHGRWIWEKTMSLFPPAPIILCCSVCYGCHDVSEDFKYCPHCGAKMDGVTDTNVGSKLKEGAE